MPPLGSFVSPMLTMASHFLIGGGYGVLGNGLGILPVKIYSACKTHEKKPFKGMPLPLEMISCLAGAIPTFSIISSFGFEMTARKIGYIFASIIFSSELGYSVASKNFRLKKLSSSTFPTILGVAGGVFGFGVTQFLGTIATTWGGIDPTGFSMSAPVMSLVFAQFASYFVSQYEVETAFEEQLEKAINLLTQELEEPLDAEAKVQLKDAYRTLLRAGKLIRTDGEYQFKGVKRDIIEDQEVPQAVSETAPKELSKRDLRKIQQAKQKEEQGQLAAKKKAEEDLLAKQKAAEDQLPAKPKEKVKQPASGSKIKRVNIRTVTIQPATKSLNGVNLHSLTSLSSKAH